jgi:hypothetical protein
MQIYFSVISIWVHFNLYNNSLAGNKKNPTAVVQTSWGLHSLSNARDLRRYRQRIPPSTLPPTARSAQPWLHPGCRWWLGSQKNGGRKGSAWGATEREVLLLRCSWVQGGGTSSRRRFDHHLVIVSAIVNTWSKVQVTEPYRLRISLFNRQDGRVRGHKPRCAPYTHYRGKRMLQAGLRFLTQPHPLLLVPWPCAINSTMETKKEALET